MTALSIREALLAAADHIKRNPKSFDPTTLYIPTSLSERADGLAWVGFFLGLGGNAEISAAAARAMGLPDTTAFYLRMNTIDRLWERSPSRCALALRAYADVFHRVES